MRENYNFEYWKDDQKRLQLSVIKGSSYRYLWHEELELMVILSGEIEYFAGGECYHLHKGDMLFFNQNCGHSIISRQSGNRTVSLKLRPQILQEWGVCISMVRPCFCITSEKVCSEVDIQLLREHIAWIYFYLKEESPIFNKSAETLTALIFIHILHRYGMLKKLAGNETKISNKNERMGVINHYITQHLTEPITLQDVAEAAGYNKTYLSSQFKQWTGFNLSDYVKQIRVQRAIGMLEEQKDTLTEIAMKSGFSDYNIFSACMLQYCGRKPQDYRNRIGNDKEQMKVQRHFAKYPDDYIEQCFENFRTGRVYGEAKAERNAEKIEEYAKAILKLVKQDNCSE